MMYGPARIDVHVHAMPAFYREAIRESRSTGLIPEWSVEQALEKMERYGIAAAVNSISPSWQFLGLDVRRRLARRCNEFQADLVTLYPSRFGGFAVLPLPDVAAACDEARHALETLKLDGVGLYSSYGETHLGDSTFDPLFEVLDSHGAVVFIHPTEHPSMGLLRLDVPKALVEFTFDTTRAAVNLVLQGVLERFPNIKFILSHAGGTLPYLAWRVAHVMARDYANSSYREKFRWPLIERHAGEVTPDLILGQIRRFWYDTALSPGPQTFGALAAAADPERVLFGSDWPYAPEVMTEDSIASLTAPQFLTDSQREAIDRGNASKLFPRLS